MISIWSSGSSPTPLSLILLSREFRTTIIFCLLTSERETQLLNANDDFDDDDGESDDDIWIFWKKHFGVNQAASPSQSLT